MNPDDAIILMSGGIDSYACAHLLQQQGFRVKGIFIEHGQAAAKFELHAARKISSRLNIELMEIGLKNGPKFTSGEIAGRNAFLIATAHFLAQGNAGVIALGIHAGTNYYDCSPPFLEAISELVTEQSDGKTKVIAPFLSWTKRDIVEYCKRASLALDDTYSCEAGTLDACGACASCVDRRALDVS